MTRENEIIKLSITSRKIFIDVIQEMTERLLLKMGADEDETFWICLALREAIINAMKHGNKFDPSKYVHVSVSFSKGQLKIKVRDEGDGFIPEEISNPLDEENLLKTSGRGIFYIKSFMDEVNFKKIEKVGMEIEMIKELTFVKDKKEE